MDFEEIKEMSQKYLFQNYGRIDIAFTHGEGSYLYDTEGKKYLDLVSGIAVNALGYAHPEWVKAVQDQVARMTHTSNLYYVKEQAELAQRISTITPGNLDRTLFVNSGAEANEGAMKLAVRYTGKHKVISALNGFHGRTAASLGATGQTKYQKTFEPLISDAFSYFDYGDAESVKSTISKDTAALLIEPIQGEGGVATAPKEFFKAVRDICDDNGTLMVVDEVQTGMGRTGKWFGIEHFGVVPDIITMAKGLGGGTPIGALVSTDEISKVMTPGSHGTTFGGNPLVCTAGKAVIDIMKKEKLVENAASAGKRWMDDLRSIKSSKIKDVRGYGLIIGIEMDSPGTATGVQKYCRDNGVLVNVCHGNVVRLIPPLIVNDAEKDMFTSLLKERVS
ncbi:MAG: acetylornithine/N-succinyldiaminopimelate aminotransferase [Candidatus Methanomethylophilaceae archaeon]|nr:acetylornithine/N-succinyldiaminopimelate aminotransferase [Candidatus Methanomethylophilaceae archaeon]